VCLTSTAVCLPLSVEYIGPRTEKPGKSKIDIIGLSLLHNDVDCRHFKGGALIVGLPAGPVRILGFWAFAANRSWPGRAGN